MFINMYTDPEWFKFQELNVVNHEDFEQTNIHAGFFLFATLLHVTVCTQEYVYSCVQTCSRISSPLNNRIFITATSLVGNQCKRTEKMREPNEEGVVGSNIPFGGRFSNKRKAWRGGKFPVRPITLTIFSPRKRMLKFTLAKIRGNRRFESGIYEVRGNYIVGEGEG